MTIEQISIFLENRAGRLAEVTHTLTGASINIRALSLADTSDFGILRLIVSDQERAFAVLREKGFTVGRNTVVAIEMEDTPGSLDAVLRRIGDAGLNVEYMYAFARGEKKQAVLVCLFDNTEKAVTTLEAGNIRLISQAELNEA